MNEQVREALGKFLSIKTEVDIQEGIKYSCEKELKRLYPELIEAFTEQSVLCPSRSL